MKKKDRPVRLSLAFNNGEINFYACAVKFIEEELNTVYDWSADVMSDAWDEKKAVKRLRMEKDKMICDALLNQDIFSGWVISLRMKFYTGFAYTLKALLNSYRFR
jgi:endonuclease-8